MSRNGMDTLLYGEQKLQQIFFAFPFALLAKEENMQQPI